ncbi:SET domain-containing protein 3 [Saxophila tyrrhenica]|uniref:SET domain-containing protein 3 n=1 Tax=Saxophila tyrrhenica TaxID=1690608 RepID=A0AAV9P397_9PEZI|nr:SET domain-containing protein 3 [Saxophila tyrrhenica]
MTESSYSVKTVNGHDFHQPAHLHKPSAAFHPHHGLVAPETQDEDAISCVCGYFDDDGWTVACDLCNKWQHQLCYYPHYEDMSLPEDLQHYCIDCRPRVDLDIARARQRQSTRRQEQVQMLNGVKRQPSKSHKKKVRDVPYTNGWLPDKARHDRNSASPRDQPPPAKRPKTSHRTSEPVASNTTKGHARKRTATALNRRRSLSRSPDLPDHLYSEEFIQCYKNDVWNVTDANLHDSIAIANELSVWLTTDPDAFRDLHGLPPEEVYRRWDEEMDDIPNKAHLEIADAPIDERIRDDDNNVLTWKTITVKEAVAQGAYLGELKGHLGSKDDYRRDPGNRWSSLRHPEPFVFFHPRLPVYVDARNEGTELRYVRRSCQPNAELQILVTEGSIYHFCFMATEQIEPGTEIAVGWDTLDSLPTLLRHGENNMSQNDMRQIKSWVSTVLANCGPCACQQHENDCLMHRLDRRREVVNDDEDSASAKAPKSKKRKTGQQVSPLNTHFNSRSGSEAHKADPDDEQSDSRSVSGSAGPGSASRDMTPNTYYSHNGSLSTAPELSERERRKVAKEEEMFARQAEAQTGKTGKKKRNSGGSTLNTPSATSSRHFTYPGPSKYADAGTSKQNGMPPAKPGRKPKSSDAPKPTAESAEKTIRPQYTNSEVQCDMDKEEAEKRAQNPLPQRRFVPLRQRLLQRCVLDNAKRQRPAVESHTPPASKPDDQMEVDQPKVSKSPSPAPVSSARVAPTSTPPQTPPTLEDDPKPDSADDVVMEDVTSVQSIAPPVLHDLSNHGAESKPSPPASPDITSPLPKEPVAPPWPSESAHHAQELTAQPSTNSKPADMQLKMPPPPINPFAQPSQASASSPALSAGLTQSPASLTAPGPPMFSPSVTAAVTPSPAKKKMSLSDYTKRKTQAKDKENTDTRMERDSSPASVASGPVVPPLTAEGSMASQAIDDDAGDGMKS